MAEVPPQLTPLKGKGDKRSDDIRKKLKGSGSKERKIAQIIRRMKELSPEAIEKKALQLATDENASSLEIMKMIQCIKDIKDLSPPLRIRLTDSLTRAHTAIHGTKSKNINLNIDAVSVWERMVEKAKKEIENEQGNS